MLAKSGAVIFGIINALVFIKCQLTTEHHVMCQGRPLSPVSCLQRLKKNTVHTPEELLSGTVPNQWPGK